MYGITVGTTELKGVVATTNPEATKARGKCKTGRDYHSGLFKELKKIIESQIIKKMFPEGDIFFLLSSKSLIFFKEENLQ